MNFCGKTKFYRNFVAVLICIITVFSTLSLNAFAEELDSDFVLKNSYNIEMCYDDYLDISSYIYGCKLLTAEVVEVNSYIVNYGENTHVPDKTVAEINDNILHATGVGKIQFIYVKESDYIEAKEALISDNRFKKIDCYRLNVNVKKAKLTVMLLAGQSNMEGSIPAGSKPYDSVVCQKGQVYSTFLPRTPEKALIETDVLFSGACTVDNVRNFMPCSLTDNLSLSGATLEYPLYALTNDGCGKTGPDSGLAYEWNRLTNEKVWTVNTAYGGSSITEWINGGECLKRAMSAVNSVNKIINAEILSGHYEIAHKFVFWMQGEADKTMLNEEYEKYFSSVCSSFKSAFNYDKFGIITPRSNLGNQMSDIDFKLTAPRAVQYSYGTNNNDNDVCVVTNVHEKWKTDFAVKSYFFSRYLLGGFSYPLRENTNLISLPERVSDVHSTVHFSQVAHNENGITAADGMYRIIKNEGNSLTAIWADESGKSVSLCNSSTGFPITLCVISNPVYTQNIKLVYDEKSIEYNKKTGQVTALKIGTHILKAVDKNSDRLLCSVEIAASSGVPVLKLKNCSDGISVTWNKIIGATEYLIYRKEYNTGWKQICQTQSDNFVDKNALSGKAYSYCVKAKRNSALSGISASNIRRSTTPILADIQNANGVKLSWKTVYGATKYYVYRKTANTSWSNIGSTKNIYYVDTKASSGNVYYYTVRAEANNTISDFDKTGISIKYIEAPKLKEIKNLNNGIYVKWAKVKGAKRYYVYKKYSGKNYSCVAVCTTDNFTDTKVVNGANYTYTVKAECDGYLSTHDTKGISYLRLNAPTLTTSYRTVNTGVVNFKTVKYAKKYNVYRKVKGGSWALIGTTESTKFADKTLKNNVAYYYTVRALNGKYMSDCDYNGIYCKYNGK